MPGCLFICVGKLDQGLIAVRPSQKSDSCWNMVTCESRRHRDGRDIDQVGINARSSSLADIGRLGHFGEKRRLVLNGIVDDSIQLMICHHLE